MQAVVRGFMIVITKAIQAKVNEVGRKMRSALGDEGYRKMNEVVTGQPTAPTPATPLASQKPVQTVPNPE